MQIQILKRLISLLYADDQKSLNVLVDMYKKDTGETNYPNITEFVAWCRSNKAALDKLKIEEV